MTESTSGQPRRNYDFDSFQIRLNALKELLAQQAPTYDGNWDENGLYWFHMPQVAGTYVQKGITVESAPSTEQIKIPVTETHMLAEDHNGIATTGGYLVKVDVSPNEVVDWVCSARHGQNIVLKDRLRGWEPDVLENVAHDETAGRPHEQPQR